MEVLISYSPLELEKTVKFISKNNPNFKGKDAEIRQTIIDSMTETALQPEGWMVGTMGFLLLGDREYEGLTSDQNTIHFEILANLAVGKDRDHAEYLVSGEPETVNINPNDNPEIEK